MGKRADELPAGRGQLDLLLVVVVFVVLVLDELGHAGSRPADTSLTIFATALSPSEPMISGVRASSIRMLSASSTRAK